MSIVQNTKWLEEKWTELMEAVNTGNFDEAESIANLVEEAGFSMVANELYKEITTAKADYEANQEPDDITHADGIEN